MRCAERGFQILARAVAREEKAASEQLAPGRKIDRATLALCVGRARPSQVVQGWISQVWTLLPANPQPAQVFERGVGVRAPAAVRVKVFHAHDECPAGVARSL